MAIQVAPSFRGFDPYGKVEIYTRNLPHWRQAGATYFVTFRLADAVPEGAKEAIRREILDFKRLQEKPDPGSPAWLRHHKRVTQRVERLLDEHHGNCVLRDARNAEVVRDVLQNRDQVDYDLYAYVIMPNHCHVMMRPYDYEGKSLEKTIQAWKSVSARKIVGGRLWQLEYYDRIVRDDVHYHKVAHYILTNAEQAGLDADKVPSWHWRA